MSNLNSDFSPDKELVVLLVDDDAAQRDYLTVKFLNACNCRVLNATCPDEAIELAQKYGVDVLVTDFLMPGGGGTGVDLIKTMGARRGPLPVMILTTGFPDFLPDETFNQMATVFCKPFSADRLIGMVLEKLSIPGSHTAVA